MMHGLAAEGDRHLDVAAPVQVQVGAGAAQLDDEALLFKRRLDVFDVDQRVRLPAVLLDEDVLDKGGGVAGFDRDVLDLAKAVALVEHVDGFHVSLSLKGDAWADCPKRCCVFNRGRPAKPETRRSRLARTYL